MLLTLSVLNNPTRLNLRTLKGQKKKESKNETLDNSCDRRLLRQTASKLIVDYHALELAFCLHCTLSC